MLEILTETFSFTQFHTEGNTGSLFDITQEGNSPQDPVVRRQHGGQNHCRDVIEVSSPRFLVDGTHVELRVKGAGAVNGIHVNDGQESEQHFGCGLDETCVLPVPAGSVQIQTVNIHSLLYTEGKWAVSSPSSNHLKYLFLSLKCMLIVLLVFIFWF